MGVLRAGILGPVENKVSGVVGFVSRGLSIIRAYAKPTNPNTEAQQFHRSLFKSVTAVLSALWLPDIKLLWDTLQSGKTVTGWSRAIKVNLDLQTGIFNMSQMVPVVGNLNPVLFTTYTRTSGSTVDKLTTNDVTGLSDLVPIQAKGAMLAIDTDTKKVYYASTLIGTNTSLSLEVPKTVSSVNLLVWAWYTDRSGKSCMTAADLTAAL